MSLEVCLLCQVRPLSHFCDFSLCFGSVFVNQSQEYTPSTGEVPSHSVGFFSSMLVPPVALEKAKSTLPPGVPLGASVV